MLCHSRFERLSFGATHKNAKKLSFENYLCSMNTILNVLRKLERRNLNEEEIIQKKHSKFIFIFWGSKSF